jgi:hypothetical protein
MNFDVREQLACGIPSLGDNAQLVADGHYADASSHPAEVKRELAYFGNWNRILATRC